MMRKPKLGQNFLIDDAARLAIVDALGPLRERTVIEIGPGHGAITSILAARCRRLIAVEIDPALAAELRFRFRELPQVEVVEADVLEVDFASLARAVVMMQREAADRLSAAPGCRDYGLLSATTQMNARVETLFTLPPIAFSPPPDVFSTVLRLEFAPRFRELGVDAAGFDAFLRSCFAQKRKTLANNLRSAGHPGSRSYTADELRAAWPAEIPPLARAESLALEPLAALYRALAPLRADSD